MRYFFVSFNKIWFVAQEGGKYIVWKELGNVLSELWSNFWSKITAEFLLVIIMLLTLTILVYSILNVPIQIDGTNNTTKEVLDYRKDTLSIVLTAFGAWIGAGAAYFFGSENIKEATKSILSSQKLSSREMLKTTYVKDVPPDTLDWSVKLDENLESVKKKLEGDSKRWFIPIVDNNGSLINVIHEEVVWTFIDCAYKSGAKYEDVNQKKVSDINDFIHKHSGKFKGLVGIYVQIKMDTSADIANNLMYSKHCNLAIITDESGKPTHYITTGDIRRLLLDRS